MNKNDPVTPARRASMHHRSVSLNVAADKAFRAVSDIGSYKDFLPMCRKSSVSSLSRRGDGVLAFDADLLIRYKKLGLEYRIGASCTSDPTNRVFIFTAKNDGGSLTSETSITPTSPTSCLFTVDLEYALRSRAKQVLLDGFIGTGVRRLIAAFERRAASMAD